MTIHIEQDVLNPNTSPALDSMSCTSSGDMSDLSLGASSGDSDSISYMTSSSVSDSSSDSSGRNNDAKLAALEQELVACKIEWAARFKRTLNKEYEIDQTVVNGISPSMNYYSPEAFKAIADMLLLQYNFVKVLFLLPGRLEVYNHLILQQNLDGNSPDITEVTEELKAQWTAEINDPVNLAAAREKTEAWIKDNCVTLARIPQENIYTYDKIEAEAKKEAEAKRDEKGKVQEDDLDLFKFAEKLIDETYKSKKAKAFRNEIELDAKDYRDRMGEKMGCPEKYQTQKAQWLAISYRKKELAGFLYFALRHKARLFIYPSKEAKSFRALRRDIVPSLLGQGKLEHDYNWWGMEVKDKSEIERKSQKAKGQSSPELSPPSSPSHSQAGSIDINMQRLEHKQKELETQIEQLKKEARIREQKLKQTVDPDENKKLKDDIKELRESNEQLKIKLKSVQMLVDERAEKLAKEQAERLAKEQAEKLAKEQAEKLAEKLAKEQVEKLFQEKEKQFQEKEKQLQELLEKYEKQLQEKFDKLAQIQLSSSVDSLPSSVMRVAGNRNMFFSNDSDEPKLRGRRRSSFSEITEQVRQTPAHRKLTFQA